MGNPLNAPTIFSSSPRLRWIAGKSGGTASIVTRRELPTSHSTARRLKVEGTGLSAVEGDSGTDDLVLGAVIQPLCRVRGLREKRGRRHTLTTSPSHVCLDGPTAPSGWSEHPIVAD